jgi:hypothetical protein
MDREGMAQAREEAKEKSAAEALHQSALRELVDEERRKTASLQARINDLRYMKAGGGAHVQRMTWDTAAC